MKYWGRWVRIEFPPGTDFEKYWWKEKPETFQPFTEKLSNLSFFIACQDVSRQDEYIKCTFMCLSITSNLELFKEINSIIQQRGKLLKSDYFLFLF